MKIKYNSELIAGGIFTVVAATIYLLIPSQIITMEHSAINAQSFPRFAMAGLFVFSLALFLQGVFRPKKEIVIDKELFKTTNFKREGRTLIFAAILVVYALVFNKIGFIVSTILLVSAILYFYYCRKWWYYAIAIFMVFVIYAVFVFLLNVKLPSLFI